MLEALRTADQALFASVGAWHAPWLDSVMVAASAIGRGGFIWVVIGLIALMTGSPARRMAAWRLLLAVGLTSLLVNAVVKPLLFLPRPFSVLSDLRVIDTRPQTGSFPSGHAANAFAGALAAARLFPA